MEVENKEVEEQNENTQSGDKSTESSEAISEEELLNNAGNVHVLDSNNKSLLFAMLKQFKVGSEVKHLQLPIFVLHPISLLEQMSELFYYPEILFQTPTIQDPTERFINVVRFYMSTLYKRPKGCKNPLNPIIGEIFRCSYTNTSSNYFAEQISHHPPHTACCYYNVGHGIALNANFIPSYAKFWGNSAETRVNGSMRLVIITKDFEEEYEMTIPSIQVKGILFGTLVMEMFGKVLIRCEQTRLKAEIDFKTKGMFRGKYNVIDGKIKKGMSVLYKITGQWDGATQLVDGKDVKDLFNPEKHKEDKKVVATLSEQAPNESRKIWHEITKAILKGDEEDAFAHKRVLEEKQRKDERERHEKKITHVPTHFVKPKTNDVNWVYKDWNNILKEIKDKVGKK